MSTTSARYVFSQLSRWVQDSALLLKVQRLLGQLRLLRLSTATDSQVRGAATVLLVYRESTTAEPLVAVVQDLGQLRGLIDNGEIPVSIDDVWWQELPLQGSDGPLTEWPNPERIHIVGTGGIDDAAGDTGFDPIASAAFVDEPAARRFADKDLRENGLVAMRTVALGPVPAE